MKLEKPIRSLMKGNPHWGKLGPALLALAMIFSLAAAAIQPAAAQDGEQPAAPNAFWNIQTVDEPPFFSEMTDRSARIDGGGNPHIAFGGKHLYYARWDPNNKKWHLVTVDGSPKVGRFASLALDSFGNPRIAYYDEMNGSLKFAFSQDRGFTWSFPFTVAWLGPQPAGAVDPENPTIEQALGALLQSRAEQPAKPSLDGGASPEAALETGVGGYTSIATDGMNRVHVSYYDWNQRALMYTRWDGVSWTTPLMVDGNPPDKGYDVGKYSSIAIDKSNLAHISYMDEKYDGLKYAYDTGSGWEVEDIDTQQAPNFRYGGFTSLVLDSLGNPYISYQDWQNYSLMIASPAIGGACTAPGCRACGPAGGWQCRIVDNVDATGLYTSLGLNSGGDLMISYYDVTNGDLHYAESANGRTWSTDVIFASGDAGLYTSLAVDGNGYPGISYYTASNGLLAFIRWTGSQWSNSGIVYAGDLGAYSSLAISKFNVPYVSFFNDIGDQLKMPFSLGQGWINQIVKFGGGSYSSTQMTQAGDPRVAFYDFANYDLVYGYLVGGVWNFQTVDAAGDVGMYPSLQLDSGDRPYISYYDETNKALKFAYWNGTSWTVQFVENAAAEVGMYNDLTLSKSAFNCYATLPAGVCPIISYYDNSNKDLKVAFLSIISAWVTQVVDSGGDVGQYSSIDLDYSGDLHVSYYDLTNGWLKHARAFKGGSEWGWGTVEVVDSAGNVGKYSSLRVDPFNQTMISYYDASQGDLKFALQSGGFWTKETVDSTGDTGVQTSLALYPNGQPAISYFDTTNGAIKFATTYLGQYGRPYYLPVIGKNH